MQPVPPQPRGKVIAWFVVQWIAIPVAFLGALLWNIAMFFGDANERNAVSPFMAMAWFVSPAMLILNMRKNPELWRLHVQNELDRISSEIISGDLSFKSKVRYLPKLTTPVDDERIYAQGVRFPRREYRTLTAAEVIDMGKARGLYSPNVTRGSSRWIVFVARPEMESSHGGK